MENGQKLPAKVTGAVGRREVELALATITSFVGGTDNVSKDATRKLLQDVSEDLKRSARRLFWLAKMIDESIDEHK
jgi:hypothetical protein